jgi:hypothetical protein
MLRLRDRQAPVRKHVQTMPHKGHRPTCVPNTRELAVFKQDAEG